MLKVDPGFHFAHYWQLQYDLSTVVSFLGRALLSRFPHPRLHHWPFSLYTLEHDSSPPQRSAMGRGTVAPDGDSDERGFELDCDEVWGRPVIHPSSHQL